MLPLIQCFLRIIGFDVDGYQALDRKRYLDRRTKEHIPAWLFLFVLLFFCLENYICLKNYILVFLSVKSAFHLLIHEPLDAFLRGLFKFLEMDFYFGDFAVGG